ncbi:hypothetical protein GH714_018812 [Hevea brasiliensis]|uniref:RNase H type-1 domain-containing protein n=1 Tax=Hevea brasiliensis TaxID=3981 RepID=A0A6A6N8S4_HEVBR|nr:hypothetical protein GH714_018812 [Hevea brasiliensis]
MPAPPCFVLKTDGAALVNYNLATGEGLIRNNCGVWVAGFSVNFDRASVEPAEMKALLEGLSLAWSLSIKRLLVFDNIENGSLKEHLNDPLKTPLNWNTRLQIANGVAAALEYLLLFSNPPIYQVSISSSNIMLDENFTAKLSSVGPLSSVGNYVTMPRASCAEDCMNQSCRNIIFQLGVLILELITGQSSEKGSTDLIQWIQGSRFRNSMEKMIDPDLGNSYDSRELKNLLAVARLCIKSGDNPKFSIPRIFLYLQKKVDIP